MTDRLTPEQRSALMSRIRGKNTRPEITLRRSLRRLGVRYRSYRRVAGATVDIVLPDRRTVVLVHGCFWHGCRAHYKAPKSKVGFWAKKVAGNRARDRRQLRALKRANWKVVVVWEHTLKRDPDRSIARRLAGNP
jgi:DNA mismatch endonuclease, patch repair protein